MQDIKEHAITRKAYIVASAIVAVTLLVASGIFLVKKVYTDPSVVFISPSHGADWIRFREPESYAAWRGQVLTTIFRTKFKVKDVPDKAILNFCAMKRATVWLNNQPIYNINTPLDEWKKVRHLNLAPMLKPGLNELRISVLNKNGHPMLLAYCNALKLHTNEKWECSKNGKSWSKALSADHVLPIPISRWFQRVDKAFISHLYILIPVFLIVFALTLLANRQGKYPWITRLTPTANRIHWLLLGAWAMLAINNVFRLPLYTGMDLPAHIDYILYVANKMRIPLATEGWQMFESPLFYMVEAMIYKAFHNLLSLEATYRILRVVPLICGAAQIELSYRALKYVYPEREDLQVLGTIIGGLLPVSIYISQVVGTEPLSGCITGIVVVLVLRLITAPSQQSPLFFTIMGLFLGLALLTKVSAVLIIVPVVLFTSWALYKNNQSRHGSRGAIKLITKRVGIMLGTAFLISGWYYIRNYLELGHLFMGGWDPSRGFVWWQDPGYRTLGQFTRFGEALLHPIYSISSVWNTLYSTMWLDGFLSGIDGENFILPWNYGLMFSNAWLSLLPLATIILGISIIFVKSNKVKLDKALKPVLVFSALCIFIYLSAILYLYLYIPAFCMAKAKYMLGLVPCFAVLSATGFNIITRKPLLKAITYGMVACWAICSYAGFFVLYNPDCAAEEQVYLANITADNGDIGESIRHYRKALSIKPYYLEAHLNLGVVLAKEGEVGSALKHYKIALLINPDCAEAHNDIGVALLRKGKIDDAIDHFKKALTIRPGYTDAKKNLEVALNAKYRMARIDQAISRLVDEIKVEPVNPVLYTRLGDLYRTRGDLDMAIGQYKKALSIRPGSVTILNNLAIAYAAKGEYEKALSQLKKIIGLRPGSADVYYNIACIYSRQNKVDKALSWLKKAMDKGFNNWALIKKDPDLENVRRTRYYRQLISGHGG